MAIRIGLVTDIHYGPDVDVRRGSAAVELLARFTARMRDQFRPDLIADLGDRINDVDVETDRRGLGKVREMLEAASTPIVYAWGNHDLINVPPADARAILGKQADYESFDASGYHIVILNSQDPTVEHIGGTLSATQLDWLEQDLRRSSLPAVVLCHHPLDEQDPGRHWYFADHPDHALAGNRERARRIISANGRVRAVFNGHMHLNTVEVIDGVPYVTVMSLVDSKLTNGPSGCFAEIVLTDGGAVEVRIQGQLPMALAFR
jgi:3',5'-cyclic-AMP phosphodiesterase